MRCDLLLLQRGLASSRAQAQRLIAAGLWWRDPASGQTDWRRAGKNGESLPEQAELQLPDASEARYVSRGGLKLAAALALTGVSAAGKLCLDVGQSTGGFTDCLLQHGAAGVLGVDVGRGQLHPRLRADTRVRCLEKVNARTLNAPELIAACADWTSAGATFDAKFELIVGDLSFISQTLVLPALAALLCAEGELLMLVKPQFELERADIGKGGLVKHPARYAAVEQRIRHACTELGLPVRHYLASPIAGGDGNREFFVLAQLQHHRVFGSAAITTPRHDP